MTEIREELQDGVQVIEPALGEGRDMQIMDMDERTLEERLGLLKPIADMAPKEPEAPFWATLDGLPSMVKALAEARRKFDFAEHDVIEAELRLTETSQYKAYMAAKAKAKAAAEGVLPIDAAVRKAAMDDFKANGEKAVYAGVSVKLFTKYDYDATQLRAWAIEQKVFGLLTLDTKRTEKAAAAGILENAPIVVSKEPRVQIATDLSSYLAEVSHG